MTLFLRIKKKAAAPRSARPTTPPTTPPAIAPVLEEDEGGLVRVCVGVLLIEGKIELLEGIKLVTSVGVGSSSVVVGGASVTAVGVGIASVVVGGNVVVASVEVIASVVVVAV